MSEILKMLEGKDRRSIGKVPEVVELLRGNPECLPELVSGLSDPSEIVRMRSADALEKLLEAHKGVIQGHTSELIEAAETSEQQEVQWHLAQILPKLQLSEAQRSRLRRVFQNYLESNSRIVQANALQALAELGEQDPSLRSEVAEILRRKSDSGSAAVRARARKLLGRLQSQDEI